MTCLVINNFQLSVKFASQSLVKVWSKSGGVWLVAKKENFSQKSGESPAESGRVWPDRFSGHFHDLTGKSPDNHRSPTGVRSDSTHFHRTTGVQPESGRTTKGSVNYWFHGRTRIDDAISQPTFPNRVGCIKIRNWRGTHSDGH